MAAEMNGPEARFSPAREGRTRNHCNACNRRPPYDPDGLTEVRTKQVVMSYCPQCTQTLRDLLSRVIDADMPRPQVLTAMYNGSGSELWKLRALVRRHPVFPNMLLAQFDDNNVSCDGVNLAHGWHPFLRKSFMIEGRLE